MPTPIALISCRQGRCWSLEPDPVFRRTPTRDVLAAISFFVVVFGSGIVANGFETADDSASMVIGVGPGLGLLMMIFAVMRFLFHRKQFRPGDASFTGLTSYHPFFVIYRVL